MLANFQHTLIPIIGDTYENLYQLGIKEREGFKELQDRVIKLLSANEFLRYGQDILSRARALIKTKNTTFFDQCIKAYAEGLGIEASEYMSFLSLFELAAHYGQIYPELKGLLPGCTSLFEKSEAGVTHSRLIDFPLLDIFNKRPRLYYWQCEGKPPVLNYACEGLAPVFIEAIHASGWSLSLHHKPGQHFHKDGQSIFQITFDLMFENQSMHEFKKEIKKMVSVTKWGFYLMDTMGTVLALDIDGPATNTETYQLNETPQLIFNNIPIQDDSSDMDESYLYFCRHRQEWLKDKLRKNSKPHVLDSMTDIKDQKLKKWIHPCSTLSTVAAYHVNLSTGILAVKEGSGALVASDAIIEFSLADKDHRKLIKEAEALHPMEQTWKELSKAQSAFDQTQWDEAYHHLQMALALCPHQVWKEIIKFYLNLWNFKFISHKRELSLVYQDVKGLDVPEILRDEWLFLCMRLEKKMGLVITVKEGDISKPLQNEFKRELEAKAAVFSTWMKLIYPRIEILEVFSPHHK